MFLASLAFGLLEQEKMWVAARTKYGPLHEQGRKNHGRRHGQNVGCRTNKPAQMGDGTNNHDALMFARALDLSMCSNEPRWSPSGAIYVSMAYNGSSVLPGSPGLASATQTLDVTIGFERKLGNLR
jgi:hypothetical protein